MIKCYAAYYLYSTFNIYIYSIFQEFKDVCKNLNKTQVKEFDLLQKVINICYAYSIAMQIKYEWLSILLFWVAKVKEFTILTWKLSQSDFYVGGY